MDIFNFFIYVIITSKVGFIITSLINKRLKRTGKENTKLNKSIIIWKERFEFIFMNLMAVLLIYVFYTKANRSESISKETKLLLFLFGFVLLITANWSEFIENSLFNKFINKN